MMPICPTYPPKTNMTMDNQQFEDVFPIEHGDFPLSCWFLQVYCFYDDFRTVKPTFQHSLVTSEFSLLGLQWTASSGFKSRDPIFLDLQGGKSMASNTWCRSSAAEISPGNMVFFRCEKMARSKDAHRESSICSWDNSPLHFLVIVLIYVSIYIICVCFFPGCSPLLALSSLFFLNKSFSICDCFFHGQSLTGWWFLIFFMFIPTWGNDPIWLLLFEGVETTK